MATTTIANLSPGDGDKPINIKVIRKWQSYGRKAECCFVFLDKSGDAIEACGCLSEKAYFDSIIKVDNCYSLSNYMCENEKTYFVTVPHKTRIKIGLAAKLQQIPEDDFPGYYFNFLAYDQLSARVDDHQMLTDYIGKVEYVYDLPKNVGGPTILKVRLENLRGKMIETTFWDETAVSFDKQAVEALPSPVIAAVTSMKVSRFQGSLQLTATPASYIYINPAIPEATKMAADFVIRDDQNPVIKIQYQKSKDAKVEEQRNRFSLKELLSQNPKRYGGAQFTCKASLVSIDQSKGWFYKACNDCRKKLQKRGNMLACENHEQLKEPNNLYFITAQMADDTAKAKIVFFDDAAAMLLQTDCNTMINQHGYTDPDTLPAPLISLIGQTKIFQVHFAKFCRPGAIDFVADAVFEDTVIPDTPKKTINEHCTSAPVIPDKEKTAFIKQPTALASAEKTPISPTVVDLPLTTPATPTKTVHHHPKSTPVTPPSAETKQPQQTSAKKQLFDASSDETIGQQLKKQKKTDGATDANNKTRVRSRGKNE